MNQKIKKILSGGSVVLGSATLATSVPVFMSSCSNSESNDTNNDVSNVEQGILKYFYKKETKQAYVQGLENKGTATDVIIPDTVINPEDGEEYQVTEITHSAFLKSVSLSNVVIGANVSTIADASFQECPELTNISVDAENQYFAKATNLNESSGTIIVAKTNDSFELDTTCNNIVDGLVVGDIVLPDTIDDIAEYAFSGCYSLKSIKLPNTIETINRYAFFDCQGLTAIDIPNSVQTLGVNSFYECSNLKFVKIGSGVSTIGNDSFAYCNNLISVTVDGNNSHFGKATNLGNSTGTIIVPKDENGNAKLNSDCSNVAALLAIGNIFLQDNFITSIGEGAFRNCSSLISIVVDGEITSIGAIAFRGCSTLRTVLISDSVKTLGADCFYSCNNLELIRLGSSVSSIPASAFHGCSSLKEISIPSSVTLIGAFAFQGCSGLKTIDIPDMVEVIEAGAFFSCSSLELVEIGSKVDTIGENLFTNCSNLITINCHNNEAIFNELSNERSRYGINEDCDINNI